MEGRFALRAVVLLSVLFARAAVARADGAAGAGKPAEERGIK